MLQDENLVHKIVLLMVSGLSKKELTEACVIKFAIPPEEVDHFVKEARTKITRTAEYDKDEELGISITRMNDIYRRAIKGQDIKTALMAQKELNKLMDLSKDTGSEGQDGNKQTNFLGEIEELDAIAGHLLPLELADKDYPLREHARIAAERIREGGNFGED